MRRPITNILSLVSGQTINLLFNLISISLAARFLGVELFGEFSSLLALVTIIAKSFDFGFPALVFRELSLKPDNYDYLNSAVTVTFLCYLVTAFLMNVVLVILSTSFTEILLLNILLFNALISAKFNNVRELLNSPFKASLQMNIPMIILNFDNLLFLILVLFMPIFNGGLGYFIVGYVISSIPGFILLLYVLNSKFNFFLRFGLKKAKLLFNAAMPLYGYLIFDALFNQLDIIMIKYFHGNFEVGIYSIAIRLVLPLLVIPYAIIQTVFPRIVQNNVSKDSNERIIGIVYKVLFVIALFVSLIFTFKADEIISFLFGVIYKSSSLPTIILFWMQIFIFYNYFTINLLLAYNKQSFIFKYAVIVLLINILFNLILIPHSSFLGASIAKLLAGFGGTIFIISTQYKLNLKAFSWELSTLFWLILILLFCLIITNLPVIPFSILTTLFIIITTLVVRYFKRDEVSLILNLLNNPRWGNQLLKLY